MSLAVDRVAEFAYAEPHERTDTMTGAALTPGALAAFPHNRTRP
jgi:hypothetical protein